MTTSENMEQVIADRARFLEQWWEGEYGEPGLDGLDAPEPGGLYRYAYITSDHEGCYRLHPFHSMTFMLEHAVRLMLRDDYHNGPEYPRYALDLDERKSWNAVPDVCIQDGEVHQ
jgi:hypothetical protein